VQPVSGIGLVVLAIYAHLFLGERLSAGEWAAAAAAGAGACALGATSPPPAPPPSAARAAAVIGAASCLLLAEAASSRARGKGSPGRRPKAVAVPTTQSPTHLGIRAGLCFGVSATACRAGLTLDAGPPGAAAAVGLAASAALSAAGFALQTSGLKDGASVAVCTAAAVTGMLAGAAAGVAALGEPLVHPPTAAAAAARLAAWALTLAGVVCLAGGRGTGAALRAAAVAALPVRVRGVLPRRAAAALRRWSLAGGGALPTSAKGGA